MDLKPTEHAQLRPNDSIIVLDKLMVLRYICGAPDKPVENAVCASRSISFERYEGSVPTCGVSAAGTETPDSCGAAGRK